MSTPVSSKTSSRSPFSSASVGAGIPPDPKTGEAAAGSPASEAPTDADKIRENINKASENKKAEGKPKVSFSQPSPEAEEKAALLFEIETLNSELWAMQLKLITDAAKRFECEEWKSIDDPRQYAPDDARHLAASIDVRLKTAQVRARIAKEDGAAAGIAALQATEKELVDGSSLYWKKFAEAEKVDPLWHHAAKTYFEATNTIEALARHDPAKSTKLLVDLGKKHEAESKNTDGSKKTADGAGKKTGVRSKTIYQSPILPVRMTEALQELVKAYMTSDRDKTPGKPAKPVLPLQVIQLVSDFGNTWKSTNEAISKEDATEVAKKNFVTESLNLQEFLRHLQKRLKDPAPQEQTATA